FTRGLVRSGLDMEGYRVTEAASLEEVVRRLEQREIDVVVTALDLPPGGSSAVLDTLRHRPEWRQIPVLTLADSAEQIAQQASRRNGIEDCQLKFDREAMLESVSQLASALAHPGEE